MDFEKLAPYDGKLGELGRADAAAVGRRGQVRPDGRRQALPAEIPGAELVAIEGAGHFVFETAPERCAEELARFLGGS